MASDLRVPFASPNCQDERKCDQNGMPSGRSFYQRRPERYAKEKKEFQRLVDKIKQLASEHGYTNWPDPFDWTGLNCSSASFLVVA